jgi:hypothetical protein
MSYILNVERRVDIPSPLERYFAYPRANSLDRLTFLQSHSQYSVGIDPTSNEASSDVYEPGCFAN